VFGKQLASLPPGELHLQNWPLLENNRKKFQKKPELGIKSGSWGKIYVQSSYAIIADFTDMACVFIK